jgi:N-acetylglucosamine kinase-like BadF-type ATPase
MQPELVLGIDAGGTFTRCNIANTSGRILSAGIAGPSNVNFISPSSARRSFEKALTEATCTISGKIAMAVVAGPHLPDKVSALVSHYSKAKTVLLIDEFTAALAAGLCRTGGWGVVVLAGTGSFCKGRTADGKEAYSGGWGPLVGDDGSSYDIARNALRAVARAYDERSEKTLLTDIMLSHLKIQRVPDLKRRLYRPPFKRHKLAALSQFVSQAASRGDRVAKEILRNAGVRLADLAAPVAVALFEDKAPFPIVLSGGVLQGEPLVASATKEKLQELRPNAEVIVSPLEPIAGTILIGLKEMGIEASPEIINNLKSTTRPKGRSKK